MIFFGAVGLARGLVIGVIILVAFVGLYSMMRQKNARIWKWTMILFISACFFLMLYEHVLLDYLE